MTNGKKNCQFPATKYYDYKLQTESNWHCDSKDEDIILDSGLCIFHDERQLQDKDNNKEQKVRDGLYAKIRRV